MILCTLWWEKYTFHIGNFEDFICPALLPSPNATWPSAKKNVWNLSWSFTRDRIVRECRCSFNPKYMAQLREYLLMLFLRPHNIKTIPLILVKSVTCIFLHLYAPNPLMKNLSGLSKSGLKTYFCHVWTYVVLSRHFCWIFHISVHRLTFRLTFSCFWLLNICAK